MADKIFIADGLSKVDEDALKFCLSCEGDVYYHALAEGKRKRLLFELLSANGKCKIIEVGEDELDGLRQGGDFQEVRIFWKKRGWRLALGVTAGLAILVFGIAVGHALAKD
jgi:hypothetical protein